MKKTMTLIALMFALSINAQTKAPSTTDATQKTTETKTIIAVYIWGQKINENSQHIIFRYDNGEMVDTRQFLINNNAGKELVEFWNPKVTGKDSENGMEYHTVSSNEGKKYKLIYLTKENKYPGIKLTPSEEENVIVSFEKMP